MIQRSVFEYLQRNAQENPQQCAVYEEGVEYSYARFHEDACKVAASFADHGVEGHAVVVFAEKTYLTWAVMMGALRAGAFYVPVDATVPAARVESILSALEGAVLVTDAKTADVCAVASVTVDRLFEGAAENAPIVTTVFDTNPAYVLFTSGSTGTPKGVAVSHRAIMDFIEGFTGTFGFASDDRIANQAPFDFDVSVKDIYSALAVGATLVLVPRDYFVRPAQLVEYLDDARITNMTWAVAALCLISGFKALELRPLSTVRRVMFSGEVMPYRHLKQWMAHLPEASFVNLYGPTEITCNCLYHMLYRNRDYSGGIPLGVAFPQREVLLVNEENQLVTEAGGIGEIVVRGTSLALGYVANPEQTARVFKQNPTHNRFPDRVYCTGDLAELSAEGELFFRGRRDNQIKFQGHRIELEELDAVFERIEGVSRCRCAYEEKRQRLYAFYEGVPEADDVTAQVRTMIPAAMVPTKVTRVEEMPLTKNGKVDRKALLELVSRKKG